MKSVAHHTIRKWGEWRHLAGAQAILETPPLVTRDDGLIIFSMIGTRVVAPYLVAAKSLFAQLGRGRFAVLDDGTLTVGDKDVLRRHLDNPRIFAARDVRTAPCPTGGCWERLFTLLGLRRDNYVIQLDSDTVTLGPVPEVLEAIDTGRNFTLGGEADARWMGVHEFAASRTFRDIAESAAHVQEIAEALLPRIASDLPEVAHYVRGCAGFAGFALGGFDEKLAKDFTSGFASHASPDVWSRWGSEQVMSNVVIANEGEPVVLPYDRYLNFWNAPVPADAALVHFIGTYRYHGGAYAKATRQAVRALSAAG